MRGRSHAIIRRAQELRRALVQQAGVTSSAVTSVVISTVLPGSWNRQLCAPYAPERLCKTAAARMIGCPAKGNSSNRSKILARTVAGWLV